MGRWINGEGAGLIASKLAPTLDLQYSQSSCGSELARDER
jgi:hypothetical protein